jgi:hypothetical protein
VKENIIGGILDVYTMNENIIGGILDVLHWAS